MRRKIIWWLPREQHTYHCFDNTPVSVGVFAKRKRLYSVTTAVPSVYTFVIYLLRGDHTNFLSAGIWALIQWKTSHRSVIGEKSTAALRRQDPALRPKLIVGGITCLLGPVWSSAVGRTYLPPLYVPATNAVRSFIPHSSPASASSTHRTTAWRGVEALCVLPSQSSSCDQHNHR
jgi:hypothetical protein